MTTRSGAGRKVEVVVDIPTAPEETTKYDTLPDIDGKIEMEDEPIVPDHYYDGGRVPVFKPTMAQFASFKEFVKKIDHYGMQSGIVKIIPPAEWRETLPNLESKVKEIRVKNPIVQQISGSCGVYKQTNQEKQKSYNLPQWKAVCESSQHQPPAKRGERRKNQEAKSTKPKVTRTRRTKKQMEEDAAAEATAALTPPADEKEDKSDAKAEDDGTEECSTPKGGRQPGRRKYVRKTKAEVDEIMENDPAWEGFDFNLADVNEFTKERCEDLEKAYWRTLTYNQPMYGADMPGSLFDENTTSWNVANLENILNCLGKKIPGVNTAYLYLGMWKSTFAWHLEDVDLYSINYIHFGAPKQWYSISQEDADKFGKIMKSLFPTDAKACAQFLRHKQFLASPSVLQSQYGIKVNKLVHHEGEFVITFPFGYHSGYNIGYNCAESVNFATEAWLEYGRKAEKCDCTDDAVWVNVDEVERKLRGEDTEEEFTEEEYDEDEDEDEDGDLPHDLPTPPESVEGDVKRATKKRRTPRKRKAEDNGLGSIKKIRLKFSTPAYEPCCLCPNSHPTEKLAPTDNGKNAHRLCAVYTPETYFGQNEDDEEIIYGITDIPKARLDLKCFYCRSATGSCFQCSEKKCIRAYHATCAAAAGVLVDMRTVPEVDEEGSPVEKTDFDFRCRFHRPKRGKDQTGETLEDVKMIFDFAKGLENGDLIQLQYYKGDIFAGTVVENRISEAMVLIDLTPSGGQMEVEWKWILAHDPALSNFPADSGFAGPHTLGQKRTINHKTKKANRTSSTSAIPRPGDVFHPLAPDFVWSEFHKGVEISNPNQENINKYWYYLGEIATENIPKFTHDPKIRTHNPESIMPTAKKVRSSGTYNPTPSVYQPRPEHNQPAAGIRWTPQHQAQMQMNGHGQQKLASPRVTLPSATPSAYGLPATAYGQAYKPAPSPTRQTPAAYGQPYTPGAQPQSRPPQPYTAQSFTPSSQVRTSQPYTRPSIATPSSHPKQSPQVPYTTPTASKTQHANPVPQYATPQNATQPRPQVQQQPYSAPQPRPQVQVATQPQAYTPTWQTPSTTNFAAPTPTPMVTSSYEAQRQAYFQQYAESILSLKQRALLEEQRSQMAGSGGSTAGMNALSALSAAPNALPPIRMLTPPPVSVRPGHGTTVL